MLSTAAIVAQQHSACLCVPSLFAVEAGDVTLGKPTDWPSYGWDNEYGSRTFHVRAFKASKALVR